MNNNSNNIIDLDLKDSNQYLKNLIISNKPFVISRLGSEIIPTLNFLYNNNLIVPEYIVNNAGISISKGILEHTQADWDKLYDILVKGQYLVSQAAIAVMRKQGLGGDIVNIVSKNAFVAGPNNVGYGSAKAAQAHMTRLLAAELGPDHIRVNTVNPDAVIADSNIWAGGWAEGRAKAYGVTVAELPAYYAKRTLLNESILPDDIANACFAFVGGLLNKSTGNALNVDGGVAAGFLR